MHYTFVFSLLFSTWYLPHIQIFHLQLLWNEADDEVEKNLLKRPSAVFLDASESYREKYFNSHFHRAS